MKRCYAFLLACACALALLGCTGASSGGPDDSVMPLTEEKLADFRAMFASETDVMDETTGEYRYTTSTPVSCFFTSYYDDPRDIDLVEILRYCPLGATLEDADAEEFRAVLNAWGENADGGLDLPSDYATPVRRIPKSDVSALLTQWAGITADDLHNTDGVTYLAQYDAFYNGTSDFGPGHFDPAGGEQYGDSVLLWTAPRETGSYEGVGTRDELTLRVQPDGSYRIESFRQAAADEGN